VPFCRECGKEVQGDWKSCPFCTAIFEGNNTVSEPIIVMGKNPPSDFDSRPVTALIMVTVSLVVLLGPFSTVYGKSASLVEVALATCYFGDNWIGSGQDCVDSAMGALLKVVLIVAVNLICLVLIFKKPMEE